MSIGSRLRCFIEWRGQRLTDFAEQAGIPYGTLQGHLADRSQPRVEHLVKLMGVGIDMYWLLTGELFEWRYGWREYRPVSKLGFAGDLGFMRVLRSEATKLADGFNFRYSQRLIEVPASVKHVAVVGMYYRHGLVGARDIEERGGQWIGGARLSDEQIASDALIAHENVDEQIWEVLKSGSWMGW